MPSPRPSRCRSASSRAPELALANLMRKHGLEGETNGLRYTARRNRPNFCGGSAAWTHVADHLGAFVGLAQVHHQLGKLAFDLLWSEVLDSTCSGRRWDRLAPSAHVIGLARSAQLSAPQVVPYVAMEKTTLYLPPDLKAAVKRVASERGISEAEVIRESLRSTVGHRRPAPRGALFASGAPVARLADQHLAGFGER
jgi:hypothetical protein